MKKIRYYITFILMVCILCSNLSIILYANSDVDFTEYLVIDDVTIQINKTIMEDGIKQETYSNGEFEVLVTYYDDYTTMEYNNNAVVMENNSTIELQPRITDNCATSAIGYSGTRYSYSGSGIVTLTKGNASKTGSSNTYSSRFMTSVNSMINYYNSLSSTQRLAWAAISISTSISTLLDLSRPNVITVITAALNACGIDLESELTATALSLTDWYMAEKSAMDAYSDFN